LSEQAEWRGRLLRHPEIDGRQCEVCDCSVFGQVRLYYRERLEPQCATGLLLVRFRDGSQVVVLGVEHDGAGRWMVKPHPNQNVEPFVADIDWMAKIRSIDPIYSF
jgi:hypothetical protein